MPLITFIVGARPNFMKAAPVLDALRIRCPHWGLRLVHTGQHYDERLSDLFFRQLRMPKPDVNLGIGSASHAVQTARVMVALEEDFLQHRPNLVVVFGDVNSTLAAAVVASKLGIAIAHVEAGLRSFDRSMPEEINRLLTDVVSHLLFVTESSGYENLCREGIEEHKIFFVGNTMIDTLLAHRARAVDLQMPQHYGLKEHGYAVVTLHRPSNVDNPASLQAIFEKLQQLADLLPVIFPVHPRTRARLAELMGSGQADGNRRLYLTEPHGYLEFIGLIESAAMVITDSGGIQEETTVLGTPCLTLRENTERPITIFCGTNQLLGSDPSAILPAAHRILTGAWQPPNCTPDLWDGKAAQRIVDVLAAREWQS
jgi:UDP-N-acetylglucosamine 2-epimerase (non-hydrolysing)